MVTENINRASGLVMSHLIGRGVYYDLVKQICEKRGY